MLKPEALLIAYKETLLSCSWKTEKAEKEMLSKIAKVAELQKMKNFQPRQFFHVKHRTLV